MKLMGTPFYFEFTEFIEFMHNKSQGGKLISDKWQISSFSLFFKVCWQCFWVYIKLFISFGLYCQPHEMLISFDIMLHCIFDDFFWHIFLEIFEKNYYLPFSVSNLLFFKYKDTKRKIRRLYNSSNFPCLNLLEITV